MGQVGGVGPAGVRVAFLVRVESVVAAVGSWRAAHGARCDQRAVAPGAIDLVLPDPNHDHDHECGEVNQADENDQGGQAAHSSPPLPGTSRGRPVFVQPEHAIYVTGSAPVDGRNIDL